MQARKLKSLLNDTGFRVHTADGLICIGSPMVSQLITICPSSGRMKYALDVEPRGKELLFIWNRLKELYESGELAEIYSGNDEIQNPISVWHFNYDTNEIEECFTDKLGWPNTTHDGRLLYENEWFASKEEAVKQAIKELNYDIADSEIGIKDAEENVIKFKKRLEFVIEKRDNFLKHLQE